MDTIDETPGPSDPAKETVAPKGSGLSASRAAKAKEVLDKIVAVALNASDQDRAQVAALVAKAKTGVRSADVVKMTPGMAAILFTDHNRQNRKWNESVSVQYADEIVRGEWEFNNQGIGFLDSGDIGDSQHRLAAIALSGQTVQLPVVYGMTKEAIVTIDIPHPRRGYDFLGIEGMMDAKRKQAALKQGYAVLRMHAPNEEIGRKWYLRPSNNRDVVAAVKLHQSKLEDALTIAEESCRGRTKPTFTVSDAAALAFILLLNDWPKARIIADLDEFQSGENRDNSSAPLFVAAEQVEKHAAKGEKAGPAARMAAAGKAFRLHEEGVKAVRVSEIRSALKSRGGIDFSYPGAATA